MAAALLLLLLLLVAGCGRHAGLDAAAEWPDAPMVYSVGVFQADGADVPIEAVIGPAINVQQVPDAAVLSVHHPFLAPARDGWHLFTAIDDLAAGRTRIAWSDSRNGVDWHYRGVVLDEPFPVAHPCVFAWQESMYMVPESYRAGAVRLYRADPFPTHWVHVTNLIDGVYVDPIPFRHHDTWWLFAGVRHRLDLHLFYSEHLDHGWRPHPRSPVVRRDAGRARSAGRPWIDDQGRLLRPVLETTESGRPRWAVFEITTLTEQDYAEQPAALPPALAELVLTEPAARPHHLDVQRHPDRPEQVLYAIGDQAPGQPDIPLQIGFRNGMALRGIRFTPAPVRPGEVMVFRFYWKGIPSVPTATPGCFVHLMHQDAIVFQADHHILPRTEIYDQRVRVPDDAPPGVYDVRLGLYWPDRGERLHLHGRRRRRSITLPAMLTVTAGDKTP